MIRLLGLGAQSTSSCRESPAAREGTEASTTLGPGGSSHRLSFVWHTFTCLPATPHIEETGVSFKLVDRWHNISPELKGVAAGAIEAVAHVLVHPLQLALGELQRGVRHMRQQHSREGQPLPLPVLFQQER